MQHLPEVHSWQNPPSPILDILDTPSSPAVSISPNDRWLVEFWRPELTSIAALAEPELGIAGFRINPQLRTSARSNPYRKLALRELISPSDRQASSPEEHTGQIINLPENARMINFKWCHSGNLLAFTMVKENGLELWVLNAETQEAKQITTPLLNGTYGSPYRWLDDDRILCKVIDESQGDAPIANAIPSGPIVQENLGTKTPSRTYTHLLKNTHDEALFEYYTRSALEIVDLKDGSRQRIWNAEIIDEAIPSPDRQYLLLTTVLRPYSYQLPSGYFPRLIQVITIAGDPVYTVAEVPLIDRLSTKFDSVRTGRRSISWRSDQAATLYWVEALDDGDPKKTVPLRDRLSCLAAPFTAEPTVLWESEFRFRRVRWGNDNLALVTERWYDDRRKRTWQINPTHPETQPKLLFDRSLEDHYNNPGSPCMTPGPYEWNVLQFTPDGNGLYYYGKGASDAGVHPFLDIRSLEHLEDNSKTQRIWECQDPYYEGITRILNPDASELILTRQSKTEPANYFWSHDGKLTQLTHYSDPAPQFAGIQKELVTYDRTDGVQLSAKLYLPEGYDADRDGPLPIIFWVYPEEFKDAKLAGQITSSHHSFSRPHFTSVLFLLTQGYAVLDNPSMPIVGEGETEPNDSYVEQLISSANAAIEYVVNRGVAARDRIAIGGHSYGAFTTANLLAHTDLFKLGIARSGAYNRTLTPFGFQGEQRDFWEASETYIHMSPFTHAAKIKSPLLLIHGSGDSNPGTYPVQTERLFEALKGLGAQVRYVSLPLEDHGYRSREGVGHTLWEMVRWCNLHL
jgi:dipeptidyl aminopeptidase/acylaminoacyl peptidase